LQNNSKSGIECLYKNPKLPENIPKKAKKQATETKRIVNTIIQLAWQGAVRTPATRQLCH